MRILFITTANLIAANLAYLLRNEGHDVKLYIRSKGHKRSLDNMVAKTDDWRGQLSWVGRDGLIVFDDTGFGAQAEQLRKRGFSVCGGSLFGDRLEIDRAFAQRLFAEVGMQTVPSRDFGSISQAMRFVSDHRRPWVIKQNDHSSSWLTYVGTRKDGADVVDVLDNYRRNHPTESRTITLQARIDGVEIGVGRFFNGSEWVGPLEVNFEHKKLFPGDLGEVTSEMGTLAWYDSNDGNRLFQETLAKLTPHLRAARYKGTIDINCIVNERGAFPLEATARFGSPIVHLQSELHLSPWGEMLKAVADGQTYRLRYRKGFGIVVLLAGPPFPYRKRIQNVSLAGLPIDLKTMPTKELRHVHFENVVAGRPDGLDELRIAPGWGYVMYLTHTGTTVAEARANVYGLTKHVCFPKMFYRNDIGIRFMERDERRLQHWGYL